MVTARLSWQQTIVLGLIFFAFAASAIISQTVFERLPHLEDELAYTYQAKIFANGNLVIDTPQPRRAYWQPFLIDYAQTGKRFGKYPPGWPALLAAGYYLGQPWIISAFFSALTVGVVFRLGKEIFHDDVGMIAAGLTAFSPMALLLNSTLMGHTAALNMFTWFMYSYWRLELTTQRQQYRQAAWWGIVAGVMMGLLVVNRPLTAIGITAPFILWSSLRVLKVLALSRDWPHLVPLVLIAVLTTLIGLAIPIFNYAATNNPTENLYLLIWDYDRVGFCESCGRNGHTIIKGIRHAKFDLSLTAADLFGWQFEPITSELQEHLRTSSSYWPAYGLSFFILPFGLLIAFKTWWGRLWVAIGMVWVVMPFVLEMSFLTASAGTIGLWLWAFGMWLLIPPLRLILDDKPNPQLVWAWLLLGVIVGLIYIQLGYWVGAQLYSTRYYFEALSAFAILSALPIVRLSDYLGSRLKTFPNRMFTYTAFAVLLAWSFRTYSIPRIESLHGYNQMSRHLLESVEERRINDQPILVIANAPIGSLRWRSIGPLMAMTGPYFEEDIVVAWDYGQNATIIRQQIIERFPDRQIIEMGVQGNDSWFIKPE